MKEYAVTLESKDGQKFYIELGAPSDKEAEQFALDKISQKGWDIYEYKLNQLERLS